MNHPYEITSGQTQKDWMIGDASPFPTVAVNPTGDWRQENYPTQLQRNQFGDSYGCVTFSALNVLRTLALYKYQIDLNLSEIFTIVMSGTVRGQGNSVFNVVESIRKNWSVKDELRPFTPDTTLDQVFSPIPPELIALALNDLKGWQPNWAWVPTSGKGFGIDWCERPQIEAGLKISPVEVIVDGNYVRDASGMVIKSFGSHPGSTSSDVGGIMQLTHAVEVKAIDESGLFYHVRDAENQTEERFSIDYPFYFCTVQSLTQNPMLYKKNGEPAIYALDNLKKNLIPFGDGAIAGGELFKALYNVTDYKQLNIIHVDTLPFEIAPYQFKTI